MDASSAQGPWALHLILIWAKHEEERIGEGFRADRRLIFGRQAPREAGQAPRAELYRLKDGLPEATGALNSTTLSRRQWEIDGGPSAIQIDSVGRRRMLLNGRSVESCRAIEGDVVGVEGVVSFLVERRPTARFSKHTEVRDFGCSDAAGIVGEHPHTWELRRLLQIVGRTGNHVLVLGPSGAGKELAARALHHYSNRAGRPLVCRNAASIPESLVEAELFGHAANYPNQGMPARPGIVGSAHGATLFLDEIAELTEPQQANLLRVLDDGEYQRLGEDRMRHSDFRLIAATNRSPLALKSDFLSRFSERVDITGLNERRGDIPLLVRHLLRGVIGSERRPNQNLIELLVRHKYQLHTRELERLLRLALRGSTGELLAPTDELQSQLHLPSGKGVLSAEDVRTALRSHSSVSAAATALGLANRYALHRLMKKWGIEKPDGDVHE